MIRYCAQDPTPFGSFISSYGHQLLVLQAPNSNGHNADLCVAKNQIPDAVDPFDSIFIRPEKLQRNLKP